MNKEILQLKTSRDISTSEALRKRLWRETANLQELMDYKRSHLENWTTKLTQVKPLKVKHAKTNKILENFISPLNRCQLNKGHGLLLSNTHNDKPTGSFVWTFPLLSSVGRMLIVEQVFLMKYFKKRVTSRTGHTACASLVKFRDHAIDRFIQRAHNNTFPDLFKALAQATDYAKCIIPPNSYSTVLVPCDEGVFIGERKKSDTPITVKHIKTGSEVCTMDYAMEITIYTFVDNARLYKDQVIPIQKYKKAGLALLNKCHGILVTNMINDMAENREESDYQAIMFEIAMLHGYTINKEEQQIFTNMIDKLNLTSKP